VYIYTKSTDYMRELSITASSTVSLYQRLWTIEIYYSTVCDIIAHNRKQLCMVMLWLTPFMIHRTGLK